MAETDTVAITVRPELMAEVDEMLHQLSRRHAGKLRSADLVVHVLACAVVQILLRGRDEGLPFDLALEDVDAFLQGGRDAGVQLTLKTKQAEGWK